MYYPPYDSYYPSDQVKLLLLWDELNIPHAKKKQVYRAIIPYVGFDVNPNAMTISLSDDCQSELITKVHNFSRIRKHCLLAISIGHYQCGHSFVLASQKYMPK